MSPSLGPTARGHSYQDLWHTKLTIGSGGWGISEDLQHWVNDALMALFFFLVGLEIKREDAKIGILAGSLVSGLLGAVILFRVPAETAHEAVNDARCAGAGMTVASAAPRVEGRLREHVHELMHRRPSPMSH